MSNTRTQKRWQLVASLRIHDCQNESLAGHLFDLTTEGIRLISEQPFDTEREYHLCMDLPDDLRPSKTCSMTARSIWCKEDINPDLYDTGFQLVDVSPDIKDYLTRLINELKATQE